MSAAAYTPKTQSAQHSPLNTTSSLGPHQHLPQASSSVFEEICVTHIFAYRASLTTLELYTAAPAKGALKATQQYPTIAAAPRAEPRDGLAR